MAKLLYVEPADEITDLVDKIRRAEGERDLVFVVPADGKVLRSPLDMQLLMQYTRGFQKRSAIVSEDPQVQTLALKAGFTTFPSLARLEEGSALASAPVADGAAVGAAVVTGAAVAAPVSASPVVETTPATSLARRPPSALVATAGGAGAAGSGGWWRTAAGRNTAIGAGAAVLLIGVLAVLLFLPSATVTVGVPAHQILDSVTVQGQTGGFSGGTLDEIPTHALQTPTAQGTFQVTPSGTQVLPAVPTTGTIEMCANGAHGSGVYLVFSTPPEFQDTAASGTVNFTTTSASGSQGYTVPSCASVTSGSTQAAIAVQADPAFTVGTQGNVAAGQTWSWPNLDSSATVYGGSPNVTFTLSNPAAMSGGTNSTTQTIFTGADQAAAQAAEAKLIGSLTTKVEQELKSLAGSLVIAEDSGGNGIQVTDNNPTIPNAGQVGSAQTLTVTVSAEATAYSPKVAKAAVLADLRSKVPSDGELLANPDLGRISVVAAGAGGNLTLSDRAEGYWAPRLDLTPYRSKLAFMTPGAARSYLLSQLSGAGSVTIHQSPFSLPWLPLFSNRIQILRESVSGGSGAG